MDGRMDAGVDWGSLTRPALFHHRHPFCWYYGGFWGEIGGVDREERAVCCGSDLLEGVDRWGRPSWKNQRFWEHVTWCFAENDHDEASTFCLKLIQLRKHQPFSLLIPYPPSNLTLVCIMANALSAVYKWAVPAALGYTLIQSSIYDVKGGTRAVIFDRLSGVKDQVVNEGTHFLIPWLQKSIIYDVRTKPRNISTTTGSKDLQMVSLTLRVLHRPEVKMLPKIYQVWDNVSHIFQFCVVLEALPSSGVQ